MKYLIYGLIDPVTNELRYIGLSTSGLKRAQSHFRATSYNNRKAHVYSWIKSCISNNYLPEIVIIEEGSSKEELKSLEQFYISYFKSLGCNLTNHTKGGDGLNMGRTQSQEEKNKRANANRGKKRSKEFCERLSRLNTGKTLSLETRQKMSKSKKGKPGTRTGQLVSDETRKKQSEARMGRFKGKDCHLFGKPRTEKQLLATYNAIRVPVKDHLGNEYPSIKAAADATGCHPSNVARVVSGERARTRGYTFFAIKGAL